jgi:hypothetical protein
MAQFFFQNILKIRERLPSISYRTEAIAKIAMADMVSIT